LSPSHNILVVEDEFPIAKLIERHLSRRNYSVKVAGTCRQALMTLRDRSFDIVIVDLSLPDADGLDVIHEIRSLCPWIRMVCISAWMAEPINSIALRAGASTVLQKPFKLASLCAMVDSLVATEHEFHRPSSRRAAARAGAPRNGHYMDARVAAKSPRLTFDGSYVKKPRIGHRQDSEKTSHGSR
jgi:two-component system, NtrC family, response regulator HydG